jgi:CRISPR-associated protein Cmr2
VSAHLLLVTLGPVQDFIAQARRTRDLWFGSHVLSEVGRAAGGAIVKAGADLVFPPFAEGDAELEPCDGPIRSGTGRPPLAVHSKLLAVMPDGKDPAAAARAARAAAFERWSTLAGAVRQKCKGILAEGIDAVWDEQIATFLDIHAAWLPMRSGGDDNDYDDVRRELEGAVSARKHLHDFAAWRQQRGNVPKSSLDGARETVLAPPAHRAAHLVRRYRIDPNEQLDAVGLLKRAGGEPEQFVPVANIALASWIEQAARVAGPGMKRLAVECVEQGIGRIDRRDLRWTAAFPLDAQVFLEDRWRPVLEEVRGKAEQKSDPYVWGKTHVRPVLDKMSPPHPYVACLVADGDRMGGALSKLGARQHQRAFSRQLSHFAETARDAVEQQHRGVLVYAGGDDLVALVCLDDALECADALRRAFEEVMAQARSAVGPADGIALTLSVGVGVGHLLESMGHLLALGHRALARAKNGSAGEGPDRSALAVTVDMRAGSEVIWRARWDADEGSPAARLAADVALLDGRLSGKKVFEIHADLQRMPAPSDLVKGEDRAWAELLAADVRHTLVRANDGDGVTPAEVGLDLDVRAGYGPLWRRIDRWIARMLVARTLGEARRARQPRRGER